MECAQLKAMGQYLAEAVDLASVILDTQREINMRIILCFLMALVAAPAWAEWVKVMESDSAVFYIDPASIREDGNLRKVWEILDLKQRGKNGSMSMRGRKEYDCKEEQSRLHAFSTHSEPMAGGKTLLSEDGVDEWFAIPPGSGSARILKIVCAPVASTDLAKWVKIGMTENGSVFYIDPASIRKDGNLRKVWAITDLKQRGEDGKVSMRGREEYDCKKEQSRLHEFSTHSDRMAGGVTLWSRDGVSEWSAVPPGSISADILKIVCAK